jgi:hypothetical protein
MRGHYPGQSDLIPLRVGDNRVRTDLLGGGEGGSVIREQSVVKLEYVLARIEAVDGIVAEPPGTDPYARWCGRGGAVRRPPIPICGPPDVAVASAQCEFSNSAGKLGTPRCQDDIDERRRRNFQKSDATDVHLMHVGITAIDRERDNPRARNERQRRRRNRVAFTNAKPY